MLTWMPDVLRAAGLPVLEVPGWQGRGHGDLNSNDILGVLLHHTAGPATGNYPSLVVVRDGRPDLAGPLANLGLARDGTWYVIAAGMAWHAGAGNIPWCPTDQGNPHLIGIEAESTGRGDWTPAQLAGYPRGVAALLQHLGLPASRAIGHKEWAPLRKIDPVGIDMPTFRTQVANLMTVPPTPPEDDVSWTHAEGAPAVPDLYPGRPPGATLADPLLGLAFAIAHAALARDAANNAGTQVAALRGEVAALARQVADLKTLLTPR